MSQEPDHRLSEEIDLRDECPADMDLRPEWKIFVPAILVVLLVSLPSILYPKASEQMVAAIYNPFAANFGTLYLWITVGLVMLCAYFAISKYGDIKFGEPDEAPEFSLGSWLAMIFSSGVAGAVMFWAIAEPIYDLISPPQHAAPMSVEAYEWSLAYLLLHWGPNAWCTYFITALPIAYIFHIKRKPFLRISSAAEMIIGKQKDGLLGRCVDVFFILGLMFCTAVTMCISLPTVEAALAQVFGIQPSFGLEIGILVVSALIAGYTVWMGLDKGIKWLSNINIVLALCMVAYAAVCGPSSTLFKIFTNALGKMIGNYWNMTFWTDPFGGSPFPQSWTIFYALFWAGYGPFMGLFIARISRGRTVREIIGWGMLGTVAGGFLIHGVLGSYSLWAQHTGLLDTAAILQAKGGPAAMIAVLNTLPFSKVLLLVYCFVSTIFLATSVNSGCYIVASVATRRMPTGCDPERTHRTFWALAQSLLALGLLALGGLEMAKMFGNFSGALMALPVLLLAACWFKILHQDGDRLVSYSTKKVALPAVGSVSPAPGKTASAPTEPTAPDGALPE